MENNKNIGTVEVGDLVKWKTKERTKVGVVESVSSDGTCTIDISEKGVRRIEKIRSQRLEIIASTLRPAISPDEPEKAGNPDHSGRGPCDLHHRYRLAP